MHAQTTPEKIQSEKEPITSTPLSQKSASNTAFEEKNRPEDYKGFLREDIRECGVLPIEDFLETVLRLPKQEQTGSGKYGRIAGSRGFKDKLESFMMPVSTERQRYHPFLELVGYILGELSGNNTLEACRNDPAIINGSYSKRSPDIIMASKATFVRGARFGADGLCKSGPTGSLADLMFHWFELLFFFELKTIIFKNLNVEPELRKLVKLQSPKMESWPALDIPVLAKDIRT